MSAGTKPRKPAIVTFIGWHNSGKTTVVCEVVRNLKNKGLRVGTIKSSSEQAVRFDQAGTDTFKHRNAGADRVMFVAPDQMVLQGAHEGQSLIELAGQFFSDMDIVIGEGFKNADNVMKIEVTRGTLQPLHTVVSGVIAVVSDTASPSMPEVFGFEDIDGIAQYIVSCGRHSQERTMSTVAIQVNGKKIPLKGFIQEALAGTLQGFISSLKLVDDIKELDIHISYDEQEDETKPGKK